MSSSTCCTGSSSASPLRPPSPRFPPRSSFSVMLEEGSDEDEGKEEENLHLNLAPFNHATGYKDDDVYEQQHQQQQQGRQRQQPPPFCPSSSSSPPSSSSFSSSSTGTAPADRSASDNSYVGSSGRQQQLGFTVDLDREFGGEYRNLWPYRMLNSVQSSFWAVCLNTDRNVVIAAPTGVGKTMALEAAICRLLLESESVGDMHRKWRVVYIAPVKALCQQRLLDWRARFGSKFGLKCAELTGDSAGLREVAASHILFATPEKFDAVSRDWRENLYLLGSVRLVLIDEAHFLGEDPRGSALESLICRLKVIKTHKGIVEKGLPASKMRILAVSATLPNVDDLGTWLEAPTEAVFNFDYTFRPVPLDVHILSYANASNPFLFQRTLESRAIDVISKYSEGKATLVFCGSKKGAETLASKLADTTSMVMRGGGGRRGRGQDSGRQQQQYEKVERFTGLQNQKLKDLLVSCGGAVAFHHAGLSAEDRACVEDLFQQGVVRVLCSTSTLAQGINSPAFLAIILGTTFWRGAGIGYEDLPVSAVLQMIGRAGRPGFDDRGVAVIMTSKDKELAYTSMADGQEVVESQLPARFHEALNAEVCSHVISDLDGAMRWLQSTFLWVRAHRNPRHYAALLPRDNSSPEVDNSVGARLRAYMLRTLAELEAEEVLRLREPTISGSAIADLSAQNSKTVVPMVGGRVMSKTMVSFQTIKILKALPFDASLEELLYACSCCPEVSSPVRKAEKRSLNDLLKRVRFSKGIGIKRCTLPPHKAFVLVQACLGNLEITDFTLKLEAETIMDTVSRIVRANQHFCVDSGRGGGAYLSLLLARSLRARMWETERDKLLLRQVEGIGVALCHKLGLAGISTFQDLVNTLPSKIEAACHRRHPWGLEMIHLVSGILNNSLNMRVSQVEGKPGTRGNMATLVVELTRSTSSSGDGSSNDTEGLESGLIAGQGRKKWWLNSTMVAFSSGPDCNLLLFRELSFPSPLPSSKSGEGEEEMVHRIEFTVPSPLKQQSRDGGDKRFCITLALISPFISLDCLQIFYPSFAENGAKGGGASQRRLSETRRIVSTPSSSSSSLSSSRHTTASVHSTIDAITPVADNKHQPANAPPKKAKGGIAAANVSAAASTLSTASAISDDRPNTLPSHFQYQCERQKQREQELRTRREQELAVRREELAREQRQRRRQEQQQEHQQQQQQQEGDRCTQDEASAGVAKLQWRAPERTMTQQKQQELTKEWHLPQEQKRQHEEWANIHRQQQAQQRQRQVDNTLRLSCMAPPSTSGRLPATASITAPICRTNDLFSSFQFAPSQRSPILDLNEKNSSGDNLSSSTSSIESFQRRYPGSSSMGILTPQPLPPPPLAHTFQTASLSAMDSTGEAELSLLHAKVRESRADQVPIHRIPKAAPTNLAPVLITDTSSLPFLKVVGSSSRVDTISARAPSAATTSKFFGRTYTSPFRGKQPQSSSPPQVATSCFGALYQSCKAPTEQMQHQLQHDLLQSKRVRCQDDFCGGPQDDEDEKDDLTLPSLPTPYGSPPLSMPPSNHSDKRPFKRCAPMYNHPLPLSPSAYYQGEQHYSYNNTPSPSQALALTFQQKPQKHNGCLQEACYGGDGAAAGYGVEQQSAELPSDSFDSAGFI